MKKLINLLLPVFCFFTTVAQKVEWADFVKSSWPSNEGKAVTADASGNVYSLGTISNQAIIQGDTFTNQYGSSDLFLIKYDSQGNLLWGKVFGGTMSDTPLDVAVDESGHLYVSVLIQSTTMMNDTVYTAAWDPQVIQFDTSSAFLRYISQSSHILIDAMDSDLYLAYHAIVEKRDTALNVIWSRSGSGNIITFSNYGPQGSPGSLYVANNGHLVVSGRENTTGGITSFDTLTLQFASSGYCDEIFLISMDTSGSALWAKTLDSTSTVQERFPLVAADDAGNVYLTLRSDGDIMIFAGDSLYNVPTNIPYTAVLKYDVAGNPLWATGCFANALTYIYDILVNPSQELVLCGTSEGPGHFGNFTLPATGTIQGVAYIAKLNLNGDLLWYKTSAIIESGNFFGMDHFPGGDYVVTGRYPPEVAFQVPYRIGCFSAPLNLSDIMTFRLSENTEPVPVASFTLMFEEGKAYFSNQSLNADNLSWDFDDGTPLSGLINPQHFYPVPGLYIPCLTATNGCGANTYCDSLIVPGIEKVTPGRIANTGWHRLKVTGGFPFTSGTVKFIRNGQPDLLPDTVFFVSPGLLHINLTPDSAVTGYWDLVVSSGAFQDTLFNAILLEQPDTGNIEVRILGSRASLVNYFWPFKVMVSNHGNQTEIGVPIYLTVSPDADVTVQYRELNDSISLAVIDSLGHFRYLTDTVAGDSVKFAALVLPLLSPGESTIINMLIRSAVLGPKTLTAQAGPSLFSGQELLDMGLQRAMSSCNFLPKCVQCAMDFLGFIPGVGCVSGAANLGCSVGNALNGNEGGGAMDVIGAISGTLLSCAGPLGMMKNVGSAVAAAAEVADLAGNVNGITDDCGGPKGCKPYNEDNWTWPNAGALDPNMISGPIGFTPENYVSREETMHFMIHFENADTATAPAREVTIYDTLDASVFDISTFQFTAFSFGDSSYPLEIQDQLFIKDIDLRPTRNIILRVSGSLDTMTHVVEWKFQSFDTLTYGLTNDVMSGFLPPNTIRPQGEGYVTYSIKPYATLSHLQPINSRADILFDANAPMSTNIFLNTVDTVSPSSQVNNNPVMMPDSTFLLTWNGTDAHAGVNAYDVFVSINDSAYIQLFQSTRKTWARLTGNTGYKYEFYSVATDYAGNREQPPVDPENFPDATVIVTGVQSLPEGSSLLIYPNPASGELHIHSTIPIREMRIIDLSGRLLFDMPSPPSTHRITHPIASLSEGIYLCEIITERSTERKTFVKQ